MRERTRDGSMHYEKAPRFGIKKCRHDAFHLFCRGCGTGGGCPIVRRVTIGSAPLPQLLPDLHQRLEFLRTGKTVVNQSAIPVGLLIEIPDGCDAEVGEIVTQFLEILRVQDFSILANRRPPSPTWLRSERPDGGHIRGIGRR
jgi:hypothetical protein